MISVSKKFSPTATTLATTSPGPATGSGISASTRSSGVPKRWQRMAFTGRAPLERCRHAIARTTAVEAQATERYLHASSVYRATAGGVINAPSHCRIPQAVHAVWGVPSDCCSRHGGGPMIGMKSATTALILVAALAPVAFAQQQPANPAATPQPQKPAASPAKPAAPAAAPAAGAGQG